MARPRTREEADLEMTKAGEQGKLIRTLLWIGLVIVILGLPVVCCIGTSVLGLAGAE